MLKMMLQDKVLEEKQRKRRLDYLAKARLVHKRRKSSHDPAPVAPRCAASQMHFHVVDVGGVSNSLADSTGESAIVVEALDAAPLRAQFIASILRWPVMGKSGNSAVQCRWMLAKRRYHVHMTDGFVSAHTDVAADLLTILNMPVCKWKYLSLRRLARCGDLSKSGKYMVLHEEGFEPCAGSAIGSVPMRLTLTEFCDTFYQLNPDLTIHGVCGR